MNHICCNFAENFIFLTMNPIIQILELDSLDCTTNMLFDAILGSMKCVDPFPEASLARATRCRDNIIELCLDFIV